MNLNLDNTEKEFKKMIKNKELTYFWQYRAGANPIYSYISPEMGIMVNKSSFEDAVKEAIEMLKHIKNYYDTFECQPQDENTMQIVNKVYSLYKLDESRVLNILGLTKDIQMQGELLLGLNEKTMQKRKTFLERIAEDFSEKMTEEQFKESFKLRDNEQHNLDDILDKIPDFEVN